MYIKYHKKDGIERRRKKFEIKEKKYILQYILYILCILTI